MAGPVLFGRATPTTAGRKGYAAWLVRVNSAKTHNNGQPGCSAAAEAQSAISSCVRVVVIGMAFKFRLCGPKRNELLNGN